MDAVSPPAARVLATLSEAADRGDPCPSNKEIADATGIPRKSVSYHVIRLEERGAIQSWSSPGGRRAVRITRTGKETRPGGNNMGYERRADQSPVCPECLIRLCDDDRPEPHTMPCHRPECPYQRPGAHRAAAAIHEEVSPAGRMYDRCVTAGLNIPQRIDEVRR